MLPPVREDKSDLSPKRTALYDTHIRYGARMAPFGGWEMPVFYRGIQAEHSAVRTAAGLFDVSHMGELLITGAGAGDLVQLLTLNDVTGLGDGQAQYSAMANAEGTLVDDLLVYRLDSGSFMLVVNASNITKDFDWIQRHNRTDADVRDVSDETSLLAVQGPLAARTLGGLTSAELSPLLPFGFIPTSLAGVEGILSRTGYTGEDGFEFYFPSRDSVPVWEALLEAGREHGMLPAGLGARNTLRLEARMLLYGNDIDETTTPFEAGLGWMPRFDTGDFIGREALISKKAEGPERKLVGFRMLGRQIARDGYPAYMESVEVGRVTSGAPSPSLGKNIGLAYLPVRHARHGTRFQIGIRGRFPDAEVVPTPFYRRRTRDES